MKSLAIDCRSINKHMTGVGNVLYNILLRLKLDNCQITLFFDRELDNNEKKIYIKLGYEIKVLKVNNYILWEQVIFPIMYGNKYDYVWFPANTGPIFIKAKIISTIHDVIFDKSINEIPLSGKLNKDLARLYRKVVVKRIASKSKRIYTVSNYSKKDIVSSYKVNENKIKVIYNGLNEFFKVSKDEIVKKENYILSFGSNEPRKNTELMINLYKYLITHYNDLKNFKLVLYGFRGYENSKIKKMIDKYNLNDKVIVYEYITNEDLRDLYRKAKVFCFLSSYEGFGLPILESMACGTPVVALDNSSISEIIGFSGVLIKDNEIDCMAKEIYNLLNDSKKYNELISLGLENIQRFDWNRSSQCLEIDLRNIM